MHCSSGNAVWPARHAALTRQDVAPRSDHAGVNDTPCAAPILAPHQAGSARLQSASQDPTGSLLERQLETGRQVEAGGKTGHFFLAKRIATPNRIVNCRGDE